VLLRAGGGAYATGAMADELAKRIGAEVRKARRALALTQADVAERAEISVEFYARIERGEQTPSVPTLAALMRILGVSADAAMQGAKLTAAEPVDPVAFYDLGSPEQRRLYRRLQDASPAVLRLLAGVLASFDHAVAEERKSRKPRRASRA
jgi:transcriptional regulator with XRE-family HTH domain